MNAQPVTIGKPLSLRDLVDVARGLRPVQLCDEARARVQTSREAIEEIVRAGDAGPFVYGVNTGFGKLANQRIAQADLETLQLNLLRSHAVGVGEPMPEPVVRLILLMKAASLARGYSGIRELVIDRLFAFYNLGITPVIPCQGSVGASGDLAPLVAMVTPDAAALADAFWPGPLSCTGPSRSSVTCIPDTVGR
jgi:histidine ammonia-lyase